MVSYAIRPHECSKHFSEDDGHDIPGNATFHCRIHGRHRHLLQELQEHLENVKAVLQKLRDAKFYVKKSKCEFASEEIDFVGFRVSAKGVRTHPEKIEALTKWPVPKNVADVRRFTGYTNFYQKFVLTTRTSSRRCQHF